ncbi:PilW family protein [Shewanella holmiensis]|uniref:Type II secretion system GspH family protein n=1 Tax=Shewanella holmiensis TaxID=2952222 RepID=A0A9X2WP12_9GAMM|nr:type II secretion system protein [Shewanella holmiensis]MCT7942656.1 type II secretion system GspH family protein [Shewanella holmiensis]
MPYLNGKRGKQTQGFTLVEMVTVILILGIIVVGVSSFVIFGTRIFVESSAVDQVLSQSRFGVERMTRDIRSALPNSTRLITAVDGSYQCIEFVPIAASTSYVSAPIAPAPASNAVSAIATNQTIAAGQWAMIYPLTATEIYNPTGSIAKRFLIANVATIADQVNITLAASVRFTEDSPLKRLFLVAQPISYCVEKQPNGTSNLKRYANYGYRTAQPSPSIMANGVIMAQNIINNLQVEPAIVLTPSSLITNAIVHVEPRFSVNGESFKYQHQVQVINVP